MSQIVIASGDAEYNTTDVRNAVSIDVPYCGPTEDRPQVALVTAFANGSSGSGTVRMGLVDTSVAAGGNSLLFYRDITVTATAVATDIDGSGSSYVCTCSCSDSADNKADLLGSSGTRKWFVWAPSAFTTITSITIDFTPTSVI